jgi:hypothetical protein
MHNYMSRILEKLHASTSIKEEISSAILLYTSIIIVIVRCTTQPCRVLVLGIGIGKVVTQER